MRRWDGNLMGRATRLEQVTALERGHELAAHHVSQRQRAAQLAVPRSTLQAWQAAAARPGSMGVATQRFFHSPEGVELLHRLVTAAHVVITLLTAAGVRRVCQFLELSGLAEFVAASYGVQQRINVALEEAVVRYAEEQRVALGATMPERRVTILQDETYHPAICLVALEPVSQFILLEGYADNRSAATWGTRLEAAMEGLPLKVVQGVSDEAKGLLGMQKGWGAHHSPDLFHVQYEVSKGTSLALARQTEQAEAAVAEAEQELADVRADQAAYEAAPPRGRPPAFAQRIAYAEEALGDAQQEQAAAEARQKEARAAVVEIGAVYHPYDLETGQAQPPERVAERFAQIWRRLDALAEAADLPERARRKIAKAQRVTVQLVATLTFFFATIQARIEALGLAPALEAALLDQLIPAIYLDRAARRSASAEQRHHLEALSERILQPLRQPEHPLNQLPPDQRSLLEQVATECADLFQRSSSAVEGRNGQLSLHHHGRHRLGDRKLAALTAVHNYLIQRPDGTTAAERLFGQRPPPFFATLLDKLPLPPRPAAKRPPDRRDGYLMLEAA
jgi:hypothetical protein